MGLLHFQSWPVSGPKIVEFGNLNGTEPSQNGLEVVGRFHFRTESSPILSTKQSNFQTCLPLKESTTEEPAELDKGEELALAASEQVTLWDDASMWRRVKARPRVPEPAGPVSHRQNERGEEESAGLVLLRRCPAGAFEALLRRNLRGLSELPKGHREEGETFEEAAVAEMNEETGLKTQVEVGPAVGETRYLVTNRVQNKQIPKVTQFFAARCLGSAAAVFEDGEAREHTRVWVTLDQLPQVWFRIRQQHDIVREALAVVSQFVPSHPRTA